MKRLLLLVIGLVVIVSIGVGVYWYSLNNRSTVTITYNAVPGANVILSKKRGGSSYTIISGKSVSVPRGDYAINVSGNDIEKQTVLLPVEASTVQTTIDISRSREALSSLLQTNQDSIIRSANEQLPQMATFYVMRPGQLYLDGTWFATRLRYIGNDDTQRDTLRLVMQKSSSGWVVMSKPPSIYLTYAQNKSIPRSIIDAINSDDVPRVGQ